MRKFLLCLQICLLALIPVSCSKTTTKSSYLFLLSAQEGRVEPNSEDPKRGTLTLSSASKSVFFFSGGQSRKAGKITLDEFLQTWNKGSDSFSTDHPNAAIVSMTINHPFVELSVIASHPNYHEDTDVLEFTIQAIGSETLQTYNLGQTVIFIDNDSLQIY